ncbi:MAG: ABC transporter ATP-binding protein [Halococcoides sp.]
MATLEVTEAVKEYTRGSETVRALDGVSLSIDAGEFVAVVGPSGSGKSTLLNLLGLLDVPTAGTVEIDGTDVATLSTRERTDRRRETIGFVFQQFFLVPTLTARENVAVPRLLIENRSAVLERADELLDDVGLADRVGHRPNELSGGQKQRVAIARGLINDPRVVLADEPTGNLDHTTGDRILDLFAEVTDRDVAVITVTHDDQVANFADRQINLMDGVIR